jgi:hypothetical protein
MEFRHAVALAPLIWYLMRPPLPHLNTRALHTQIARPLSRRVIVKGFPTQKECEAYRRDNRWDLCIASDDRRLAPRMRFQP